MKTSKVMKLVFLVVLMLTLGIAALHLSTREQVPPRTLSVEYAGETHLVDFADLTMEAVHGTRVNGKGETKEVNGEGCLLQKVLQEALGDVSAAEKVTVVAGDGFSAEVNAGEWEQPDQVYLITQEDGTLQLIVFGDSDSKRSVKNVERLLVE